MQNNVNKDTNSQYKPKVIDIQDVIEYEENRNEVGKIEGTIKPYIIYLNEKILHSVKKKKTNYDLLLVFSLLFIIFCVLGLVYIYYEKKNGRLF